MADRPKVCPKCRAGGIQMIDTDEYYCVKCGHQWIQGADGKVKEVVPEEIIEEPVSPVPVEKRTEGETVEPKTYSEEEIQEMEKEIAELPDKPDWESKGDPREDLVKAKEEIMNFEDDFTRVVIVPDKIKEYMGTREGQQIHRRMEVVTGYKLIFKTPSEIFGGN